MRGFNTFSPLKRPSRLFASKRSAVFSMVVIGVVVLVAVWYINSLGKKNGVVAAAKSEKIAVEKTYDFEAIIASDRTRRQPVTTTLKNVQKTTSIRSNNKTQSVRNGSSFILLTFVIENDSNSRVLLPLKDYVRFIDPNGKKFAPSITDSAVVVEPQATKIGTVGYVEPNTMKKMKFSIGPLESDKETIEINFK